MEERKLTSEVLNEKLHKEQQDKLKNIILNGYNPKKFIVEDFECAWGKSTFALETLPLYIQKNPKKRVLYVSERKEQCEENAQKVNELFGKDVAGAIVGGMPRIIRNSFLENYNIIFLTHERYKRLSRLYNEDERRDYINNRHLLIIDEKIEMCKEVTFSLTQNALLENEIYHISKGGEAINIYKDIVANLLVILKGHISKKTSKSTVSHKKDITYIDKKIQDFRNFMLSSVEEQSIFYRDFENQDFQTILEKVEDLRNFYVGKSIEYYNKKEFILSVPNYSLNYWTLENNIILDATASIDKSYSFDTELFTVAYEKKVFSHNKWSLEWANINSSTNGRTNVYSNYKDTFNVLVEKLGENDTLVFAKKYDDVRPVSSLSKDVEKINKFKGIITHKGQINSNNDFEKIKNAINSDSNYEEEKSYVLKYLYYSRNPLKDWSRNKQGFKDTELENFKIYEMARGLYQFFKRINRNMEFESKIILLIHYEEIKDIILNMLQGINYKHSLEIEKMFIKKNPSKLEQFEEMCNLLLEHIIPDKILEVLEQKDYLKYKTKAQNGIIQKKVFAKALNTSIDSFKKNILNYQDKNGCYLIKDFFKENNIEEKYQTINFK